MENYLKKLRELREELVRSQRYNYVATRSVVKPFDKCIEEMDSVLDEMENNLTHISDDDFKKATAPAIRYLFKNHDPHTKIFIDYSSAELLQGQRCCNLDEEIPD